MVIKDINNNSIANQKIISTTMIRIKVLYMKDKNKKMTLGMFREDQLL